MQLERGRASQHLGSFRKPVSYIMKPDKKRRARGGPQRPHDEYDLGGYGDDVVSRPAAKALGASGPIAFVRGAEEDVDSCDAGPSGLGSL